MSHIMRENMASHIVRAEFTKEHIRDFYREIPKGKYVAILIAAVATIVFGSLYISGVIGGPHFPTLSGSLIVAMGGLFVIQLALVHFVLEKHKKALTVDQKAVEEARKGQIVEGQIDLVEGEIDLVIERESLRLLQGSSVVAMTYSIALAALAITSITFGVMTSQYGYLIGILPAVGGLIFAVGFGSFMVKHHKIQRAVEEVLKNKSLNVVYSPENKDKELTLRNILCHYQPPFQPLAGQ